VPVPCPHGCGSEVEYVRRRAHNWDAAGGRHTCGFLWGALIEEMDLNIRESDMGAISGPAGESRKEDAPLGGASVSGDVQPPRVAPAPYPPVPPPARRWKAGAL
jgi:hypothetical protein